MNKLLVLVLVALMCIVSVKADVNTTINIGTNEGDINAWINSNSGEGETNYYIDGINFKETMAETDQRIKSASRSGRNVIDNIYEVFMKLRYNPSLGKREWIETEFDDLYDDYQKLRYVLDTWFVPRKEMVTIIQKQQAQISQLQLEVEAIGRSIDQDKLCDARQQVMIETGIASVTCGEWTYYNGYDDYKGIIGMKTVQ